jgi:hypothetical protein
MNKLYMSALITLGLTQICGAVPSLTFLLKFTTGTFAAQAAGRGGIKYSVDKIIISTPTEPNRDVTAETGPIPVNPGVETSVDTSTDTVTQQPIQCSAAICVECDDPICAGCPQCGE